MEEKLRFLDGSEMPGYLIPGSDGVLYLYLQGQTLAGVYPVVSDPKKTKRIWPLGSKIYFEGYTHLFSIREEMDGTITAGLKKA